MQGFKFIKSFSKGQITIPKELRALLGLEDEFWMKLSVDNGKLIAEPIEPKNDTTNYRSRLLSIKSDWFSPSTQQTLRQQIKKRLLQNRL